MYTQNNSLTAFTAYPPTSGSLTDFVPYDTKSRVKIAGNFSKPTLLQFGAMQKAYDYFNAILFSNALSPVMLVLCRGGNRFGTCYIPVAWTDNLDNNLGQIKINPAVLAAWPARIVYARLVHDMCHHWQHQYGKPGRNGYHNREFASKMESLGLHCYGNGASNGKHTGQHVTELITDGGAFDCVYSCLPADFIMPFRPVSAGHTQQKSRNNLITSETESPKNKIKYTCPSCGLNAWGKPGLRILCETDLMLLENR